MERKRVLCLPVDTHQLLLAWRYVTCTEIRNTWYLVGNKERGYHHMISAHTRVYIPLAQQQYFIYFEVLSKID